MQEERAQLSEADSRLLDALSQPEPAVVTAVEDQPPALRAAQDDRVAPSRPAAAALTPLFQEPSEA